MLVPIDTVGKWYSSHLCSIVVVRFDESFERESSGIDICIPWTIWVGVHLLSKVRYNSVVDIRTLQGNIRGKGRIFEYFYLEISVSIGDIPVLVPIIKWRDIDVVGAKTCLRIKSKVKGNSTILIGAHGDIFDLCPYWVCDLDDKVGILWNREGCVIFTEYRVYVYFFSWEIESSVSMDIGTIGRTSFPRVVRVLESKIPSSNPVIPSTHYVTKVSVIGTRSDKCMISSFVFFSWVLKSETIRTAIVIFSESFLLRGEESSPIRLPYRNSRSK